MEDPFLNDELQLDEAVDLLQRLREEEESACPDPDIICDLEEQLFKVSESEFKKRMY